MVRDIEQKKIQRQGQHTHLRLITTASGQLTTACGNTNTPTHVCPNISTDDGDDWQMLEACVLDWPVCELFQEVTHMSNARNRINVCVCVCATVNWTLQMAEG